MKSESIFGIVFIIIIYCFFSINDFEFAFMDKHIYTQSIENDILDEALIETLDYVLKEEVDIYMQKTKNENVLNEYVKQLEKIKKKTKNGNYKENVLFFLIIRKDRFSVYYDDKWIDEQISNEYDYEADKNSYLHEKLINKILEHINRALKNKKRIKKDYKAILPYNQGEDWYNTLKQSSLFVIFKEDSHTYNGKTFEILNVSGARAYNSIS